MKYSILLPTHNRADVLPFAIRSALAQTETDWELLIVGDGCSDGTADVVATFRDERIRWFDLPKGPGFGYGNRNIALRQARGEYMAFLAHDDLWFPDHLALLADCIVKSGNELVYSRPLWVEPGGAIIPGDFDLNDPLKFKLFMAMRENGIPASCVLHRRDCYERYGYWNDALESCADWDMWIRIIVKTGRFGFLREPTTMHFRAHWRKQSNVVSKLVAYPDLQGKLPALQLPPSITEQDVAWRKFAEAPVEQAALIRAAILQSDEWVREKELPLPAPAPLVKNREWFSTFKKWRNFFRSMSL